MVRQFGTTIYEMIKKANIRGIETWGDLSAPRCAFDDEQIRIFGSNLNDIQFHCPPFFDISPDLYIWRCLNLAEETPKSLKDFNSLRDAYKQLNKIKDNLNERGVYDECKSCKDLKKECSGGPAIAKILKNGK